MLLFFCPNEISFHIMFHTLILLTFHIFFLQRTNFSLNKCSSIQTLSEERAKTEKTRRVKVPTNSISQNTSLMSKTPIKITRNENPYELKPYAEPKSDLLSKE